MGSNALFSPQEIQQAGGSAPSAFSSPAPGGNLFSPDEIQKAGGNSQAAPSGVGGFFQGVYENTLKPVADIASDYLHQTSAGNQAVAAASDQQKRAAYAEAGQHLKNGELLKAAGSLMSLFTDDPEGGRTFVGKLIDAHTAQAKAALEMAKAGRYSEAAGHGLAAVVPGIGPAAAQAGEEIGQGNIAHGAGQATGLIADVVAPKLATEAAGKALGAAAESVAPETVELPGGEQMPVRSQTAVGKLAEKLSPTEAIDEMDRTAQNPAGRRGIANLANEVADTGETVKATPPVEDPLGIRDASESLKARSKAVWNKLDELSDGKFSEAQQDAADAADDFTAAGKRAYREALAKQDAIFDQYADQLPEGTDLQKARAEYRQYNGMQKLAKSFDTAFETTPGQSDSGYVNADRLREKIADMQQQGVFKQAGFSKNHVETLDQIAVRMQDAAQRAKLGKVAQAAAGFAGYELFGGKAVAAAAGGRFLLGRFFGKMVTDPQAAGVLLQGLKAGRGLDSLGKAVAATMTGKNRSALQSTLAGDNQ